jgi:hypothetical protein
MAPAVLSLDIKFIPLPGPPQLVSLRFLFIPAGKFSTLIIFCQNSPIQFGIRWAPC